MVRRGHRVILILEEAFKGKFTSLGFEEEIYQMEKSVTEQNPGEVWTKMLTDCKVIGDYSVWEKLENMKSLIQSERNFEEMQIIDATAKKAIAKYKPDLL